MSNPEIIRQSSSTTTTLYNKVPEEVRWVIGCLRTAGYEAWLVGGAVRDLLLDREPKDWDVTTDAPVEIILSLARWAEGGRLVDEELQVVALRVGGHDVQVARYRRDGVYSDGRRPDDVEFETSLDEDLRRRDFTINACALYEDTLVYPMGALHDLKHKVVRCVGDAKDRVAEDKLRALRFFRFCAQLDFTYDIWADTTFNTAYGVANHTYDLLTSVSVERVRDELNKIMMSSSESAAAQLGYLHGLLSKFHPCLRDAARTSQPPEYHAFTVWGHMCRTLASSPQPDLALRWAAFLHDVGKPHCQSVDEDGSIHFYGHDMRSAEVAVEIMRGLKQPRALIDEVEMLIREHMAIPRGVRPAAKTLRRIARRLGSTNAVMKLIVLRVADIAGTCTRMPVEVLTRCSDMLSAFESTFESVGINVTPLAVNGRDVMDYGGVTEGPEVGRVLAEIAEMVDDNPELNDKDTLRDRLCKYNISGRLV